MKKTETKSAIRVYLTHMRSKYGKTPVLFVVSVLLFGFLAPLTGVFLYTRGSAYAAPSATLNFQGRLMGASGSLVADGTYNIEFNLYTAASGGTTQWTEDYLNTGTPVTVKNGFFSVYLGSLTPFPGSINWDQEQFLGMTIRGTGSCVFAACTPTDAEMTPRFKLTAIPRALSAANVNSGSTSTASTNSDGVTVQSGNATGATSNSGSVTIDAGTATGTAGALLFGTANASALTLGRTGITTTLQGSISLTGAGTALNVTNNATIGGTLGVTSTSTFTGLLTANGGLTVATGSAFTNASSTLFSATAIANVAGGGSIGSAATTVDVATTFNINQTTAAQTLTLATPTVTTAGRIVFVNNVGSTSFTMYGTTIGAGASNSFMWNGTAWVTSISLTSSVVNTIGTIDTQTKSADGAVIAGNAIYLQSADATHVGLVTATTQTFGGDKTFNGAVTFAAAGTALSVTNNATIGGTLGVTGAITIGASQTLNLTGGNTASRPGSPTEGMIYYDTTTKQLLIYANGKWQADRTTATKIVAANNSSQAMKDAADYVADGTGDQTEINAALTAASGGKVYLAEGTYVANATILIPNNTTLSGAGWGTIIELADLDATDNLIENTDKSTGSGVIIRDIKIDGRDDLNTAGTQNGIYFEEMGAAVGSTGRTGALVTNVYAEDFRDAAYLVFSASGSGNNSFIGNTAKSNTNGFYINISDNNVLSGNTSYGNTSIGYRISVASNNTITGNVSHSNAQGFALDSSSLYNTLTGNVISTNTTYGIIVSTSNYNVVSNNNIYDNGGATTNNGIYLSASDNNTITGNSITDSSCSTNCYAINVFNSTSDNNYLASNRYTGTSTAPATINDSGTNTIYGSQLTSAQILQSGSSYIRANVTSVITGSIDPAASTAVTGVNTLFLSQLQVGDRITVTGETRTITAIASNTALTVDTAFSNNANDTSVDRLPASIKVANSSGTTQFIVQDNGVVGVGTVATNAGILHVVGNTGGSLRSGAYYDITSTDTAGDANGTFLSILANPGSASTQKYAGVRAIASSTTSNTSGATLVGVEGEARKYISGSVGTLIGGNFFVSTVNPGTVTTALGARVENLSNGGGTVTGQAGIAIAEQSGATNNSNLIVGATTVPTGQFSIYNSSTDDNVFAGNLRVGSATAPTVALDVTGAVAISTTLAVTGNTTLTGDIAVNGGDITATGDLTITPAGGDTIVTGTLAVTTLGTTNSNTYLCRNASNQIAGCTLTPISATLTDNIADALDIQEGSNNYFNINTTNSSENISLGNATTNPSFNFLGTGTLAVAGSQTIAGDLAVNGDDITGDSNLTVNATGYVRIGDTGTPGVATGDDDLYVEGDLEVDATVTIAGTTTFNSNLLFNQTTSITGNFSAGAGYTLNLIGGAGTTTSGGISLFGADGYDIVGGNIVIAGGASIDDITGGANGGSVSIQGGGSDTGTQGAINIGTTTGSAITLGRSGVTTTSAGNLVVATGNTLRLVGGASFPGSPAEGQMYFRTDTKQLYVYANGKWQADRSTASVIVADGSTTPNPERADYVVPAASTSAQTTINNAITSLPSTGGVVILLEGTYTTSATINLRNGVTIQGMGKGATTIKYASATNGSTNLITGSSISRIGIRDLTLDGNKAGQSSGTTSLIGLTSVSLANIENIEAINATSRGIEFVTGTKSTIKGSYFTGNTDHSIYFNTSSSEVTVEGNTFNDTTTAGNAIFVLSSSKATVANNVITWTNSVTPWAEAIELYNTSYSTVTGNTVTGGNHGIRIMYNSDYNTISGNSVTGSKDYTIGAQGDSGSNTADYNTFSGNYVANGGYESIILAYGAHNNTIVGNTVYGSLTSIFLKSDADNAVIENNTVYVTSTNNGIVVDGVSAGITDVHISNNTVYGATGQTGLNVNSSATGTVLNGNTFFGFDSGDAVVDTGTGTLYKNQSTGNGASNIANRGANSATAFAVQNAAGTSILNVNTSTAGVTVDGALAVTGNTTLTGDLAVNGDDITGDSNLTVNATGYVRIGDTGTPGVATGDDDLYVEGDLEVDATLDVAGAITTANNIVVQGGTATLGTTAQAGSLIISDGTSSTVTIKSATQVAATNYDITIPAITASDTFCLLTANNCSGISKWTDAGTQTYLTATTDELVVGSSAAYGAKVSIIGTSDQPQLLIRADAAQSNTNPLIVGEDSTGAELFRLSAFGTGNLVLGNNAGNGITTAAGNTFIGQGAGTQVDDSFNVAIGTNALGSTTTGGSNVAIGWGALGASTVGDNNIAIGTDAGTIATGGANIIIGVGAGTLLTSGSGNIIIGRNVQAMNPGNDNQLNIANAIYGDLVNSRISIGTSNVSGGRLTVDNAASTDDIFVAQDNSVGVFTIADGGNVTMTADLAVNGDDITSDSNLTVNATGYVRIGDTGTPGVATGDDDLYVEGDLEVDATLTVAGAATVSGLLQGDLGATISGAAISLNNNSNFTTDINTGTSTGAVNIGSGTGAKTITIGNTTGATALNLLTGTGNFSLDGVAASTYVMGASTVGGTITVGGTAQTGALTIGQSTASNTVNIATGVTASGNTQTVHIGDNGAAGSTTNVTIGSTIAGTTTVQGSTGIALNSATITTNATTLSLFNTNAATVTLLQAGTSISVGATTGTLTVRNANTTIGNAAGSGTFTNNGSTKNTTSALGDLAAGAIGTAAATVDVYTNFTISPTASGRTYTIPAPTDGAAGRTIYISNINATNTFVIGSTTFNTHSTATLVYDGTSWNFAGMDGGSSNYIQNQNTADQTANFRISGTGRANTSFTSPLFDSITGAVSLGSTTATGVTIGGTTNTTSVVVQGAAASTYVIGTSNNTGGITLGNSTATNTINIGAAAGNTATQTINIGTSATAGSTTNVNIGSTIAGGVTVQSGATGILMTSSGLGAVAVRNTAANGFSNVDLQDTGTTTRGYFGFANTGASLFAGTAYFGTRNSTDLLLATSDTERIRITSAGAITLKNATTISPTGASEVALTVNGTTSTAANALVVAQTGAANGVVITASNGSQTTQSGLSVTQSVTTTGFTGNFVNFVGSSTTGSGNTVNITGVNTTSGNTLNVTNNAITTGNGVNINHTTSAITTGSLLGVSSTAADALTTGALVNVSSSGNFTSTANTAGLLNVTATASAAGTLANIANSFASQTTSTLLNVIQSGVTTGYTGNVASITGSSTTGAANVLNISSANTTAGNAVNVTANALTTGDAVDINHTTSAVTTGALLRVSSTSTDLFNTAGGLAVISSSGAFTSTNGGSLLNVSASATTTGTLVNIASSAAAQTSSTLLNVVASGYTTGYTGNVVNFTGVSTTGASNLLNLTSVNTTAGNALNITANGLTSGNGINFAHTTSALTSGSLVNLSSSAADALTTGALINVQSTGNFTSTANTAGLINVGSTASAAGTLVNIANSYASQTTSTALNIVQSGVTTGYTGNFVNITGASTTGAANILNVSSANTTAGNAVNITANAITTGGALRVTSSGTGLTTGSLLYASTATTGAIATNGAISFQASGNYTSTSNIGLLSVLANATTAGTVQNIESNALVSGRALSVTASGTGLTTGSLLYVSTATTGAVATNGVVSLNATGNYTSTTNAGLLNVTGNATTAGTIVNIQGTALTSGTALNVTAGVSAIAVNATGRLIVSGTANDTTLGNTASVSSTLSSTTNTQGALVVSGTASPGSASTQGYAALIASAVTSSGNITGAGVVSGFNGVATFTGTGTLPALFGGGLTLTNASTGTISSATGLYVANITNSGTISRGVGVNVLNQTAGTANANLLLGSASGGSGLTGNWSIYSDSAYQSAFAGNLRVGGTTAPVATLDVTGSGAFTGNLTVGSGAGVGQLTNNGSTVNSTLAVANDADGGALGAGLAASASVDVYTSISINQTTASQTITLPTPTASSTYGRMLYVSNIGTASFTINSSLILPGSTGNFIWSNTNGGASWQYAGDGGGSGNYIQNQSAADQTGDFRISGTGRANTSITTPLVDSITGALSIGTSTATGVTVGGTTNTTAVTVQGAVAATYDIGTSTGTGQITVGKSTAAQTISIASANATTGAQVINIGNGTTGAATTVNVLSGVGTAGASILNLANNTRVTQIDIGNIAAAAARTINLGTGSNTVGADTINIGTGTPSGAGTKVITIGSAAAVANTTLIQGGTGTGVSLQVASTGTIAIGSTTASTINLGTGAFAHTIAIGNDNTTTQGITIGSTSAASTTTINGGTGTGVSIQVGSTGAISIGSATASTVNIGTGAFAHTVNIATDATTNQTVAIGSTSGTSSLTLSASGAISLAATGATFTTGARTLNIAQSAAATIGGALTVTAGQGGTGTGSVGGALNLQGGAAGGTDANGGNVVISGGAKTGTGVKGLIVVDTTTYSAATVQNFTASAAITLANVNTYGSLLISGDVAGWVATLPDPTITTTGRILYITNSGTVDITLAANTVGTALSITLKPASTATMYWNGSDWTAAGASSSTDLQAAYNNTAASSGNAEIVLKATGTGGLTVRNGTTTDEITGGLLEVQTAIGSNLFTVNSNTAEYANNGGAESSTFTMWGGAPAGGTAAQYTTPGSNIATGVGSVFVNATSTANTGAKNTLSTTLTQNLKYKVSYTVRHTSTTLSFSTLDTIYSSDGSATTATCASSSTAYYNVWTRVDCTFTATAVGASNAIIIRHSDAVDHDFYIDNLSVTVSADVNHAADGTADVAGSMGATSTFNWVAMNSATVAQSTSVLYDTSGAVSVTTGGTANRGVFNRLTNNIAPSTGTTYRVSFYARGDGTNPATLAVTYTPDNGSNTVSCQDYNTQVAVAGTYTLISCYFTTAGTAVSNAQLRIQQSSGSATVFYVDALNVNLNSSTSNNVQIGGANKGGPTTLFTLDRSAGAPIAANNDTYLGSMYYDTTSGRIQCYEADGWGACGAAPDNIVNLNPEYAGAVLNGDGVGTMTADFCSNQVGVLEKNTSLCSTGQAKNYYRWTSPQATTQTYSIYVTYQLPTTFNGFSSDDTVQLVGRVDNTTNASVTYEMFKSTGSAVSQCYSGTTETNVITGGGGSPNTWYSYGINGNESTGCSFTSSSAGNFVIFKINMKAKSSANAYVSTLSFTTTGR